MRGRYIHTRRGEQIRRSTRRRATAAPADYDAFVPERVRGRHRYSHGRRRRQHGLLRCREGDRGPEPRRWARADAARSRGCCCEPSPSRRRRSRVCRLDAPQPCPRRGQSRDRTQSWHRAQLRFSPTSTRCSSRSSGLRTTRKPLPPTGLDIHRVLMERAPNAHIAGTFRTSQNWIGGNGYNPCGAGVCAAATGEVARSSMISARSSTTTHCHRSCRPRSRTPSSRRSTPSRTATVGPGAHWCRSSFAGAD